MTPLSSSEQSASVERIYEMALQQIVDKHDTEDHARRIASKALGDANEYRNTGTVAWKNPLEGCRI